MRRYGVGQTGRVLVLGVVAGSAMLTGCLTDQQRDVELYRRVADVPGAVPSRATDEPMPLTRALALTAAYNEVLAQEGELYIQALADRQRAAAALAPTFDLFAGLTLRENTGRAGVVQGDAGVGGQYRLLTGLSDLRAVDAAEATAAARRWLILDLRESLLLETGRAYYEALRAERLTEVLESSVGAQEERLADARARNEVGFARPLDVAQIEAQVSRTRVLLIGARRATAEARATLTLLTNMDAGGVMLSDGFTAPDARWSVAGLVAAAERSRQDVVAARNDADTARAVVDAAIGQYAPAIGVNLDYFLAQGPDDTAARVASLIEVRVPIFSAGRIEAEVRGAWSAFRERVLEYRLRVREVRRDIETALAQLEAARAREAELRQQVEVARQTLALAEASYQAGLGTNLERVTAQDELLNAELQAVSEAFEIKTAYLALLRASGRLAGDLTGAELEEPSERELTPPESPVLERGEGGARSGAGEKGEGA